MNPNSPASIAGFVMAHVQRIARALRKSVIWPRLQWFAVYIPLFASAHSQLQAESRIPVLHALVVVDTDSNLREYIRNDGDNISQLLEQAFSTRPNRLNLKLLDGKKST